MLRILAHAFILFLLANTALALEPIPSSQGRSDGNLRFYDLTLLPLEGRGWTKTPSPYHRLPASAQDNVPPAVWNLSRHSAGLCARFVTDAQELSIHWILTSDKLDMPHMPSTGVSGVDLYLKQSNSTWRWIANGRPSSQDNTFKMFDGISTEPREFCLYLPLYNGVSRIEIGIPSASQLSPAPPRPVSQRQPIVFYGTSITQGGCASRPGMVHTAIIGRALNRPVINLGFSGSGKMEPELAELLAQLDPALFILDCLPNMDASMVNERVEPFVKRLRESRPNTPILLVEDRLYADGFFKSTRKQRNRENQAALKRIFGQLQTQGNQGLYYLPGELLLGRDGEDTVDGSHPTDLGFIRQSEAFLQILQTIFPVAPHTP